MSDPSPPLRGIRAVVERVLEDLDTIVRRDPSIADRWEALLHASLIAVWSYRVSHCLHERGRRRTARAVMVLGRLLSGGVEIHPAAKIGRRFFIDHGTATVIGGTCVIGDDVTLYHQVTLGARGWWTDNRRGPGEQRHPTLEDGVIVGANATVLGPVVVGAGAIVGANALVLESVPARGRVPVARAIPALGSERHPVHSWSWPHRATRV